MQSLIPDLIDAGQAACREMRKRITNVRYAPFDSSRPDEDPFTFEFDGIRHRASKPASDPRGISQNDCESDKSLALSALLSGNAVKC
jgi:hypothetical protein